MSVYLVSSGISKLGTLCDGVKAVLDAAKGSSELPPDSTIVVRMLPTVTYDDQPRFTVSPVAITTEHPDRALEAVRIISVNVAMTQRIGFADDDAATEQYRTAYAQVEAAERWIADVEYISDGDTRWDRETIDVLTNRPPLSPESGDQYSQFTSVLQVSFVESSE